MKCVLEPGAVMPILKPLRSACIAIGSGFGRQYAQDEAGKLSELNHSDDRLTLGLHLDGVVERAGDDIGAAADQRLQRSRAAGEIRNLHVEAGILEVAEPLDHRQRQIEHRGLAADREPHLGLRVRIRGQRQTANNSANALIRFMMPPAPGA